ncbi:MAG: response regulator [Chlorobi bacterium]|nr:response regulator [Chlorobiota bacterium]
MTLTNRIYNLFKPEQNPDKDSERSQESLMLSFALIFSAVTAFVFSIAHIAFFDKNTGFVLLFFFVVFLSLAVTFKVTGNYKLCSIVSISVFTIFFLLILFAGAGDKTGIMWGLAYPVLVAFTVKYRDYNIYSLLFFFLSILIFLFDIFYFKNGYTADIIMRYLFAYFLIYLFIGLYLRIKQETIYRKEKELIEVKHKLSEKDAFLSSLSYEIRTPLNNIAGIINHQKDIIDENVSEEIELSVSNLASILNKISEKTENNTFKLSENKSKFDVNLLIKNVVNIFRTEKYSKLRFNLFLSDNLPGDVYADKIGFMQLLISVFDFFFNNSGGNTIKLDIVSSESERKNIAVKIMSKYEKLSFYGKNKNAKDIDIIKKLADSSDIEMFIKEEEPVFSLIFYLRPDKKKTEIPQNTSYRTNSAADNIPRDAVKLKDANVLLVEDDAVNSKVMILNIKKYVNKIIVAENGKIALDKFSENKIDIILTDIRMPFMDGFKTTEKIREAEIGTGSKVPIIAVTANASSEFKKRCLDAGMNDFTSKPVNYKLLIKKMQKLLEA